MPPRRRNQCRQQSAAPGYRQLERRMSLLAWLHHLLGYGGTAELLDDIKQADEGFTPEGPSHVYLRLSSRSVRFHDLTERLAKYDANIRAHLAAMNAGRAETITLRYFQYLAALYTEIYLDCYCRRSPSVLLCRLNDFVRQHNIDCRPNEHYAEFDELDLQKLAFWMATGSGKTLLLHLNYRQFLHYNGEHGLPPPDNILLITPNEGLSRQHIEEMQASNIPAARFNPDAAGGMFGGTGTVQVTEITRLVEEKRGGGIRVPVETFEGDNLIFVDEGHKGSGGNAWRSRRGGCRRWPDWRWAQRLRRERLAVAARCPEGNRVHL